MSRLAVLVTVIIISVACGQSSTAHNPSPAVSATPVGSPSPTSTATPSSASNAAPLTGVYGILLTGSSIELVKPDATIAATATIASSSVQYCSTAQDGAVQMPPVSASNNHVYFRDGDTNIRRITPPSGATAVTTVPGGPSMVSFFSVSPDDQRIAVVVEDLSGPTSIGIRLYVEDLIGHGNHADIYTTSIVKGKGGSTLWPMGWHQGALVLAVVAACSFEPGFAPTEWHVSDAATANRIATIKSATCSLGYWPSPAGVACVDLTSNATTLFSWSGAVTGVTGPGATGSNYAQAGLSPSGQSVFFTTGIGVGSAPAATGIVQLGPGPYGSVSGHMACAWIDEDHLLAYDAVIQFPAGTPGNVQVSPTVTALPDRGSCAGRFPGGL